MATPKTTNPTPVSAPTVGATVVSNSTDIASSNTASNSFLASTPTSTQSTTSAESISVTTNLQSQNPVVTDSQTSAISLANTQSSFATVAPTTTATSTSGPTVTKVVSASQVAAPASPVIVSKPVPKDNADSGDRTLALVKPPVEASEPPKQPTRNDVRVTTTTVASGVAVQKVDPIKPSSTEFYNQVISGLWNAK
jgi:hypothetical protein